MGERKLNRKDLGKTIIEYIWSLSLQELSIITRYKLAEKFEINKNYLSEKFKKDTQMTVFEFIQKVKIKRAEDLLKTRYDLTIKEISELIGILKVDQFRKYFRKNNGVNPNKYRNIYKT